MRRYRWLFVWLSVVCALAALAQVLTSTAPRPARGLTARFYAGDGSSGEPLRSAVGSAPSTRALRAEMRRGLTPPFLAEWSGFLLIHDEADYEISVIAPSAATTLTLDGRDTLPASPTPSARRVLHLARGLHAIRVGHPQPDPNPQLHIVWKRAGEAARTLEESRQHLLSEPLTWTELQHLELRSSLPLAAVGGAIAIVFGAALWIVASQVRRLVRSQPDGRRDVIHLAVLALLTFGLAAWGIEWGLPAFYGWAPDELQPIDVIDAVRAGFIHGWHDLYPPLHYYIVGVPTTLVLLGAHAGWFSIDAIETVSLLYVAMRVVSVCMAAGTIGFVYLTARELMPTSHALCAALLALCSLTFLYYAKTANVDVPYLFWVMTSMWAYVRYVLYHRHADLLWLAAAATAAVCTKDQAYAFYVLLPLPLIAANIRHRRAQGDPSALRRGLFDPAFAWALALGVGIAAAIYLLPLNPDGIRGHLHMLRKGVYPPMAAATIGGQWWLARLNVEILQASVGWPAFLLGLAGLILACRDRAARPLLWLLVPIASYYLTFVCVVRYTYDRFLLGIWLLLAIFGGYAAGRLLAYASSSTRANAIRASAIRAWVIRAALIGVYVYSLLYAVTVNALLDRDARYAVEQELRARVSPFEAVATIGKPEYMPRLTEFYTYAQPAALSSIARTQPDFLVVDERSKWRDRTSETDPFFERLDAGELGYARLLTFQSTLPWWALARDSALVQSRFADTVSNLDKVNPRIAIYRRVTPR